MQLMQDNANHRKRIKCTIHTAQQCPQLSRKRIDSVHQNKTNYRHHSETKCEQNVTCDMADAQIRHHP